MTDRKRRLRPPELEGEKSQFTPLKPEDEKLITRSHLCARWDGCSEKAVLRVEKRLGLTPYRFLREVRYRLSDVLKLEHESSNRLPKRFVGLRPHQKARLLEQEREEASNG